LLVEGIGLDVFQAPKPEPRIHAVAIAAFYPDGKDRATLEILETGRRLS
jgi:hypothetical protein